MEERSRLLGIAVCALLTMVGNACEEERPSQCEVDGYCDDAAGETALTCPEDCRVCDNDGCCEPGEGAVWCSDCAGAECSPYFCDVDDFRDVLVAEVRIPESASEAATIGVDLDGDGITDNHLGWILERMGSVLGLSFVDLLRERVQRGDFLLVGRSCIDSFDDDDFCAIVFLGQGSVVDDATPTHEGNDHVAVSASFYEGYLCGAYQNHTLNAGPSIESLTLDLTPVGTVQIVLERFMLQGQVSPEGWFGVQVGGGLSPAGLRDDLLPPLAAWLDAQVTNDGSSEVARLARDSLDGQCSAAVPGCEPLPVGCAWDGAITEAELQCNALVDELLVPDVDVDGDGHEDLISFGLEIVRALPVTVVDR